MLRGGLSIAFAALCVSSCVFDSAVDDSNERDSDDPIPDATPGATADAAPTTDLPDADLVPCTTDVTLTASKFYDPSVWDVDVVDFGSEFRFPRPDTIAVTSGNAGNHCARLEYGIEFDLVVCAYKGGADLAHVGSDPTQIALGQTFHFVECRNSLFAGFPDCGESPSGSIVTEPQIDTTHLGLLVNGDSEKGPTVATVSLTGECL